MRRRNPKAIHAPGPEWLVIVQRAQYLRRASVQRGVACACAAMVDHSSTPRQQPIMRRLLQVKHISIVCIDDIALRAVACGAVRAR